jgi:oxygen-independent coproporphyrinogen-3 oxidase
MAGLYIHVPFCRAKCAYCDFYSGPLRTFQAEAFAEALRTELAARRAAEVGNAPFNTIYVGGGTPSSVSPALFSSFVELAAPGAEITIEANPEDVTPQWVDEISRIGFNRVSMGVQSLIDAELQAVGRRHDASAALHAIDVLRHGGITNISCDLIYGLPLQTLDSWRHSLHTLLDMQIPHLSAYLLSYEEGTRLYAALQRGKLTEASDALVEQMYSELCSATRGAGLEHYEISNFAKPSMHSRHNSAYWDGTPYLGLGPGAHSFDGKTRRYNPGNYNAYVASPATYAVIDDEDANAVHNDRVITALRTARGIAPEDLNTEELHIASATLMRTAEGRFRISEEKWLLSNTLMEPFIRVE